VARVLHISSADCRTLLSEFLEDESTANLRDRTPLCLNILTPDDSPRTLLHLFVWAWSKLAALPLRGDRLAQVRAFRSRFILRYYQPFSNSYGRFENRVARLDHRWEVTDDTVTCVCTVFLRYKRLRNLVFRRPISAELFEWSLALITQQAADNGAEIHIGTFDTLQLLNEAVSNTTSIGEIIELLMQRKEYTWKQAVEIILALLFAEAWDQCFPVYSSKPICSRPWTGFEVQHENGDVSVCCWAKRTIGNVNRKSVPEIWNGPEAQEMRKAMAAGNLEKICHADCPVLSGYLKDPVIRHLSAHYMRAMADVASRSAVSHAAPLFWKISDSTLCNLDCVMCYQDRNSKQRLPESFYSALQDYYAVAQEFLLLGGEPLLIRRLRQLIATLGDAAFPDLGVAIITNGQVFDDITFALVRRVRVSWVVISVDAASKDVYERIRRKGSFDHLCEGIKRWSKLAREMGFELVLSFTIMRDNAHEIPQFVQFGHRFRLPVQFSFVHGDFGGQNLYDRHQVSKMLDAALSRLENHGATEPHSLSIISTESCLRLLMANQLR